MMDLKIEDIKKFPMQLLEGLSFHCFKSIAMDILKEMPTFEEVSGNWFIIRFYEKTGIIKTFKDIQCCDRFFTNLLIEIKENK